MELSRFKQQAAKAFTRLSLYKPLFGKSAGATPTERAAEIEPKLFTSSKGFQNLCFRHILYHLLTTQWRILGGPPPLIFRPKWGPKKNIFFRLRIEKIQWFLGYCILFRLRNTLIIDNSDNTIRTQYTVDNFSAATNVQQMLLFYSSHLYGLFFFDHISFGFVVVFIYKTVKHKIAQVNTPLHLIWQYSISMVK